MDAQSNRAEANKGHKRCLVQVRHLVEVAALVAQAGLADHVNLALLDHGLPAVALQAYESRAGGWESPYMRKCRCT